MRVNACQDGGLVALALTTSLFGLTAALPSPNPKFLPHWSPNRPGNVPRGLLKSVINSRDTEATQSCSEDKAPQMAAEKNNVWGSLTTAEAVTVVDWLFAQPTLNLTTTEEAGDWDNTLMLVELQMPNKTAALDYMDGDGPEPPRYAHVVLNNRATEEAHYQDLLVGPLPLDNATVSYQPLEFYHTRKNGGKVRNLDADETEMSKWINQRTTAVANITMDLWGLKATGDDDDSLYSWGFDPYWQDDGRVIVWYGFWRTPTEGFDTGTLMPLGLYVAGDMTGRDPSQWKELGWFYNGEFFETTDAFTQAYWSGALEKIPANVDGEWGHTDPAGEELPYELNYPPTAVAPSGSRFRVDYKQQYVEWMGFSFYIGFSRDTGMSFHDIKYNGERIAYEIGLQEALAHYAGGDPTQSGTAYLDSYYGFGPFSFQLVPGYDCPEYSTFLNSSFYAAEETHYHPDSICLFEWTDDYPLHRHSADGYVSNAKNTHFSVRSVSTVGNYDYMFTYSFFMDGSFTVEVRASGYIQSASFTTGSEFGYRIEEALSGSMHDHVLNFKVDFDILGTSNTAQTVEVAPVTKEFPFSFGKPRNTMHLVRSTIPDEGSSRFNWSPNSSKQLLVVNTDQPNRHGEYRGYRLAPLTAPASHLTVVDSSNLGKAAGWSTNDVHISRQKDTEPRAAHPYNSQDVHDPPIDFDAFFADEESLEQEDLVFWLNVGMHHVPHTGDLPNTVFTQAHAALVFSPSNYFASDVSKRSRNAVRVNYGNGTAAAVEMFGQRAQSCEVDFTPVEHDLWKYKGDVVVRKFPYDPEDWWYDTEMTK